MSVEPRAYAACGVVAWLRRVCAPAAGALLVSAFSARATDLQIVSLTQTKPGIVVATVRTADRQPPATAFHLLFPFAAPTSRNVVAKEVAPVGASADLATTIVICVDRSGSMHRVVPSVKAALQDAFATPRSDLRAELLTFGTGVSTELLPLSTSQQDMSNALNRIRGENGSDGKTLLYDAIVKAINRLRNDPAVHGAGLLVISDGKDEGSSISLDRLVAFARQQGVRIDSIGYGKFAPQWSKSLEALSNATGGSYLVATADSALSDAIRDDLGTTSRPAFAVRFEYAASSATAAPGAAMLQYAVAGARVATAPIREPIAAPSEGAGTAGMPTTGAAPGPDATLAASSHQDASWFGAVTPWLNGVAQRIGIAVSGLVASALSLLISLGWLSYAIYRRHTVVTTYPPAAIQTSAPARPVCAPTQVGASFPQPARGRPAALLIGQSGSWRGQRFPIERATIHIGSDEKCDLALTGDEFVSHRHADIRYESGALYVSDLTSTNGTFVNGSRVAGASRVLTAGDDIRFGRTSFELRACDEAGPIQHRGGRHSVP